MSEDQVTKSDIQPNSKPNSWANWGLGLGIACIFLGGSIGMLPIATIIVSAIGVQKASISNNGMAKSVIGVALGSIYFLVYLYNYGYI